MAAPVPMKGIVIVGGGFAGVRCAEDLARSGKVRVTLVDLRRFDWGTISQRDGEHN